MPIPCWGRIRYIKIKEKFQGENCNGSLWVMKIEDFQEIHVVMIVCDRAASAYKSFIDQS